MNFFASKIICKSHSYSRNRRPVKDLAKRVHHTEAFDSTLILKVLGIEYRAAGQLYGLQDQGVPEREPMQAVQINRRENIANTRCNNIEFRDQFYLATRALGSDPELARRHDKIFLKNLERNYACPSASMFGK